MNGQGGTTIGFNLMRYRGVLAAVLSFVSIPTPAFLSGAEPALPVRNGRPVVATVSDEPITLDEFVLQIEPPADTKRLLEGRATAEELELLDRLVIVRLIAQEADTMGLADLPEIRKQVEVRARAILREVLVESVVKDVKADPAAVEKQFRELVKEYRTVSLLFESEDAAKLAHEEITSGGDFAAIAARATADKKARTEGDDGYHPVKDYLPQIGEALAKLEAGQVSPIVHLQAGFVVVKLVDVRYPENAEARTEAESIVLDRQRLATLQAYEQGLRDRYVVVKKDVLDGLDYSAKEPGISALLKDTRVVAEVKDAAPVTVGDLTDHLRMQSFHGGDEAAQGKRLNSRKAAGLDATLERRVLNAEALRLGLDKTDAYLDRVNAFEESLIFNGFVQKVIVPESKMREEEVKRYYDEHIKDFSSPEMVRVRSLAFTERGAAENAVRKLLDGADFGWLAGNAEGQVAKGTAGVLSLDGRPVTTDSMPDGMQKALAGAKTGESRLYASPEGTFYVLAVQQVVSPSPKPYDEVRADIAKKLHGEKLKKGVEGYAAKLRALSKVEIYLTKTN